MKFPILNSLTYPNKQKNIFGYLDFGKLSTLSFADVDYKKYPLLKIAYQAAREGGSYGCVLNAANEVAVNSFLKEEIKFTEISVICEKVLNIHRVIQKPDIETIIETDKWSRNKAKEFIN